MMINAPFSTEQIDALNRWQRNGSVHEFTCPAITHYKGDTTLVATRKGWICPHCDYTQNWAHASMLQEPKDPFPYLREIQCAEFGYKACEKGDNIQMMTRKLIDALKFGQQVKNAGEGIHARNDLGDGKG